MLFLRLSQPFITVPVNIVGNRSGKGTAGADEIVVTEEQLKLYRQISRKIDREGRNVRPQWDGRTIIEPPDARIRVAITHDGTDNGQIPLPVYRANGTNGPTLTFTKLRQNGNFHDAFNGNVILELANGMAWRIAFVNGLATHKYTSTVTGRHLLFDVNSGVRIDERIEFLFVENI